MMAKTISPKPTEKNKTNKTTPPQTKQKVKNQNRNQRKKSEIERKKTESERKKTKN